MVLVAVTPDVLGHRCAVLGQACVQLLLFPDAGVELQNTRPINTA